MIFKKKKKLGTIDTLIDKDIVIRGDTSYSGGGALRTDRGISWKVDIDDPSCSPSLPR